VSDLGEGSFDRCAEMLRLPCGVTAYRLARFAACHHSLLFLLLWLSWLLLLTILMLPQNLGLILG